MHHVPRVVQVRYFPSAFRVKHILVVVDEFRVRGDLQPLVHGMYLAHAVQVHHQHSRLEIPVRITHMQDTIHVVTALAILHIQVAEEVDISNRADGGTAEVRVIQLRDVAVDDQIAVQI